MIILRLRLLKKLRISGIALYPFVLLRDSSLRGNPVLLNHERIHLRQQLELGIVFFYLWYLAEYCFGLLRYRSRALAYRNIIFEREAYAEEQNLGYLSRRRFWNFLRYRP